MWSLSGLWLKRLRHVITAVDPIICSSLGPGVMNADQDSLSLHVLIDSGGHLYCAVLVNTDQYALGSLSKTVNMNTFACYRTQHMHV